MSNQFNSNASIVSHRVEDMNLKAKMALSCPDRDASERRLKVIVLFGGRSAEHEVSVRSARAVIAGLLSRDRYEVIPVAITRGGQWLSPEKSSLALEEGVVGEADGEVVVCPGKGRRAFVVQDNVNPEGRLLEADVVFPVMHGTFAEDGTVQGLLEMADIPYVGDGVSASAVGMDKDLMKKICADAGIRILPYCTVLRSELKADPEGVVAACLRKPGLPCFVKPANLGSSVGISKATSVEELKASLELAARYDRKLVVEQAVDHPMEVETAVAGNDEPHCSYPGEIVVEGQFYDYDTKYNSPKDPTMRIPAQITPEQMQFIVDQACAVWKALDLNGLAREDFMIDGQGQVWFNEVNTMPGFTKISMYGKLWEKTGTPYADLLDVLVDCAFERYADRKANEVKPG